MTHYNPSQVNRLIVGVPVGSFESRNDYLVRGETKVCQVTGYHVSLVHDCKKGGC